MLNRHRPWQQPQTLSYITLLLLVISAGLNVVQASRLGTFASPAALPSIIGTIAPALSVRSAGGRVERIGFDGRPTILYYFNPGCAWCERNWLNVKALVAGLDDRYRFIGVSTTSDVTSYLRDRRLTFEAYGSVHEDTVRSYHFSGTPHMVSIGADGRVEGSWVGAFGPRQQRDIEAHFGVILPGLKIAG